MPLVPTLDLLHGAVAAHTGAGSNANLLVTPSLTIGGTTDAWTGTLDLGNNKIVVQTSTGTDAAAGATTAEIYNQLRSGINAGPNNLAVLWLGTGIQSSAANQDTRHITGIGMLQNNDQLFSVRSVDSTISAMPNAMRSGRMPVSAAVMVAPKTSQRV